MKIFILTRLAIFISVFFTIINHANAGYDCFEGRTVRIANISGNHKINIPFDNTTMGDLQTITATSSVPQNLYVNNNGKDYNTRCKGLSSNNPLIGNLLFEFRYKQNITSPVKYISTNIPGISYYVRFVVSNCQDCPESTNYPYKGSRSNYTFGSTVEVPAEYKLTIVKTSNVTQSGYIDGGQIASKINKNSASGYYYLTTDLYLNSNAIYINVLKCSLNQTHYNINLGDWYDTQFKHTGDTSEAVNVPISLKCQEGTNINVTVTSTHGSEDPLMGKLNLASEANKASGIAVQLLDNNEAPIKLNEKLNQKNNTPNGEYIFNWKARYIKTSDKVTPGSANASATVNIRYE